MKQHQDEVLCCCQYEDVTGETNHILMACCDCEAFDNICERCCSCQGVQISDIDRFLDNMQDRCRFPSCTGRGAIQIRPDLITPMIMIPLGLNLSAINSYLMYFVFTVFSITLLGYYRIWKRRPKRVRNKFFYSWAMTSCLTLYYVFQLIITVYREVLFWENLLFSTMFAAMMYCLYVTRRDPGVITPLKTHKRNTSQGKFRNTELIPSMGPSIPNGGTLDLCDQHKTHSGATLANEMNGYSQNTRHSTVQIESDSTIVWCESCRSDVPAVSSHCPVCDVCVLGRDHHCIWVDNCIGENNHRAFFLGLVLLLLCGMYGSQLLLTTVCTPEMYYEWFLVPADCRLVYNSLISGLGYASVMYTLCSSAGLSLIFLYQVLLISQNITSQELLHANRQGNVRLGFYVLHNLHTRGLYRNWKMFITGRRRRLASTVYA